jgi:intein/homing endonuclease
MCTEDHPLLTDSGMRSVSLLGSGDRIAVNYFQGVELSPGAERSEILLAKVFGYLLGGGSLQRTGRRFRARAYGNKVDMERMRKDLEKLGYEAVIYQRTRDQNVPPQHGMVRSFSTDWELRVRSREFVDLLLDRGMPIDRRTTSDLRVPEWLMKGPLAVKRLSCGLFGDLHLRGRPGNRHSPSCVGHNSNDAHIERQGRSSSIDEIAGGLGVETTKISEGYERHDIGEGLEA